MFLISPTCKKLKTIEKDMRPNWAPTNKIRRTEKQLFKFQRKMKRVKKIMIRNKKKKIITNDKC